MSGLFIPGIMVNLGILLTPGKPDSKARCFQVKSTRSRLHTTQPKKKVGRYTFTRAAERYKNAAQGASPG